MDAPTLQLDFTRVNPGTMRRGDSLSQAMHKIQVWADQLASAWAAQPVTVGDQRVFYGSGAPSITGQESGDIYIDVLTGDVYSLE